MYRAFIIPVLCAGCALGQTASQAQRTGVIQMPDVAGFGPIGITTALAGPSANVTGAPYSAQSTTERVQTLADGNRIVQTTTGSVARDSQGRVRRDESLPGFKTNDGEPPHLIMIDDPVAQVHWTLDAQTKTATKMPFPSLKVGPAGVVAGSGMSLTKNFFYTSNGGGVSAFAVKTAAPFNNDSGTKTDLGTQTIEGVSAQGTRLTRVIPAGQLGNEQAMTITTETWYSSDLKVLVSSKSSDPRMGDTTYSLTNIQRSEPAASLFQVPDEYTIRDGPAPALQIQKEQ